MKDSLGDRMKEQYEDRTRYLLPRRTYTIIRLDGRAFHTFTKGFEKPFSDRLHNAFIKTTKVLCEEISGSCFGYTQSDEISILLTDFRENATEAWFNGNLQKICSVSASIATSAFHKDEWVWHSATFDSRVFTIPDRTEVENYFIWRQKDATRNSISSLAQSQFSNKELLGKSCDVMQEMLFSMKGINWNDYPEEFKRGSLVAKTDLRGTGFYWGRVGTPIFTQDREVLQKLIPRYE